MDNSVEPGENQFHKIANFNPRHSLNSSPNPSPIAHSFHRLFYVSKALIDPCGSAPREILDIATERNAALGVTGVLCFSGDHFAQLLEGDQGALAQLMDSIRRDPRHQMLQEWPAETALDARWFGRWAMGYAYDERLEALVRDLFGASSPALPMGDLAKRLFSQLQLYRGQNL